MNQKNRNKSGSSSLALQRVEQERPPEKNDGPKFHNPYNFVPSIPRPIDDEHLGDFKPVGHDRYLKNYWSGRITCSLITATPLLIPDATKLKEDENKHKTYPVRKLGKDPYLAPTSVKGMLRNAYEAVTNSRFGVFEEHGDRLAYRMSATNVKVVPARVEYRANKLVLRLMNGNELMGRAGKLPYYPRAAKNKDKNQCDEEITFPLNYQGRSDKPEHGDKVWVRLNELGNDPKKTVITRIRQRTDGNNAPGEGNWRPGWVCIGGESIEGKKYERVFIESEGDRDRFVELDSETKKEMEKMWRELIKNYQDIHKKDLKQRDENGQAYDLYVNHKPGKTAWSRHVYKPGVEEFKEGTLCYVDLDQNDKVKALLPVILSRRLYETYPGKLLHDSLHPPVKLEELSPSDRLFGWVNQKGAGAYRGQLRINGVKYQKCKNGNPIEEFKEGLPLSILAEPKPQQARFYLGKKRGEPLDDEIEKKDCYREKEDSETQQLRGRKVYPHHQGTSSDWDNPMEDRTTNKNERQEYRRPKKDKQEQKDDQNRSILGWVKKGTEFEFSLDIVNLSSVELGALLWLLDFEKYEGNSNLFHRLGGGKPFGFGSVQIEIKETDLRRGQDWQKYYNSLFLPEEMPEQEFNSCVEAFKDAIKSGYRQRGFKDAEFISAFLKSAEGFHPKKPVHYPRVEETRKPEDENFEWFVENEGVNGLKLSLPALSLNSDKGLPYKPVKPEEKEENH